MLRQDEILARLTLSKGDEEVCLNGMTEEAVLSFLTVVVHYISHDGEVTVEWVMLGGLLYLALQFNEVLIGFSMSMCGYEHDHTVDDLLFLSFSELTFEKLLAQMAFEEAFNELIQVSLASIRSDL